MNYFANKESKMKKIYHWCRLNNGEIESSNYDIESIECLVHDLKKSKDEILKEIEDNVLIVKATIERIDLVLEYINMGPIDDGIVDTCFLKRKDIFLSNYHSIITNGINDLVDFLNNKCMLK